MIERAAFGAALLMALTGCGDTVPPEEPFTQPDSTSEPSPEANAPITRTPAADATASPPVADSECGAGKLGRFVNLLPTSTAKAQIAETVGERTIRYIEHGQAIDADFVPSRLNVELGVDGRIKRFRCG